jgi:hypothetical protein
MNRLSLIPLSTLALLAAPAAAQGIVPYLPKETMAVVSAPDLSMSMADFAKMPLAKMWAEKEVQAFVANVRTMVGAQWDEGMQMAKEMHAQGALPVDPAELTKLRLHGGTFAVTKLALEEGDFGPLPKVGFVLHLDFGDSAPTWNALIQTGLGMLEAEAGDEMAKTESTVGGVTMLSYAPKNARGSQMGLNLAMVPNGILIGTLAEDVQSIVGNMTNKTAALTTSDEWVAGSKRLQLEGAELSAFVRPDSMVDFAMTGLRAAAQGNRQLSSVDMDGVERALQAMGWRDLGTMAMASQYVDGKSVSRTFHAHGKGGTAAPKTVSTSFLKWVPKDAVSFGTSTLDLPSFYDTIVKGLQAYDANFAEQMLAQLAEMEKQMGFSVRQDLFGSIGDHYISWSMAQGSPMAPPEMAILVKVTNEESLVKSLKNIARMSNGAVEVAEGEKRGIKVYELRVNMDPTRGMGGFNPFDMIQPTFAFKDGYMVLGFSSSDIKRTFQRMDRKDDPAGDIRSNKEFAAVADSIPSGVSSLSFTDWKATFESYYQLATGLLAFMPMPEDLPLDMSLLPDSATLTKHLFAAVSYSRTDATGTESVDVSPFGPETMLMLGAIVAGGVAFLGATSSGF